MFEENQSRAPVLVLGVGNSLLADDGTGIELVNLLSQQADRWGIGVEFLEGGTQGLALLNHLPGRDAIVLLDAVAMGAEPGTVHILHREAVLSLGSRSSNAHEGNAGELLRTAMMLGDLPPQIVLIGVEPSRVETGIGLSREVRSAMPAALEAASRTLDKICGARDPKMDEHRAPDGLEPSGITISGPVPP